MTDLQKKLQQQLTDGADQLSVSLNETQIKKLLDYLNEFDKWNKAYNLSAIRNIEQMVARHILDSLSVVPYFQQSTYSHLENIIDVGTGGGLPGIPLAIMFPEKRFTLLDSNGKKTRFLFHVKALLGLDNITVENRRVEQFQPAEKFQAVISRAFASLQDMTEGCIHLLAEEGIFMAMKGLYPDDELLPLQDKVNLEASCPLNVPETDGERHLLILKPVN
ncbi:MAG TPA: 16S rRNA (guanine(527)-N(7))-methyltransferase RsmG [Cellvibrio sp.]|nr:16S rRNA (guanine(527)-N(7))-methyltransferase RsmG [Cellvibrio sp.]